MAFEQSSASFYQSSSGGGKAESSFSRQPIGEILFTCTIWTHSSLAAGDFGGSFGGDAQENYSSYQSSGSAAGYGEESNGFYGGGAASGAYLGASDNLAGAGGEYYSSSSSSSSYGGAGNSGFEAGYEQQGAAGGSLATNGFVQQSSSAATTTYATDAQGLFQDPNPEVIRRPATEGTRSYVQRVVVRFLQPPPVPPPGVTSTGFSTKM